MPDIKWIKITTEMFDDEKIRIIEAMPEADAIIVIWMRLICMAGKVNAGGHIFLAPNLPYDVNQLATIFNRPLLTVKLALATFQNLQMIDISANGNIFLPNFEKHQNIEGMERVRENTRRRVAQHRQREKVKLLPPPESDITDDNEPKALRNVTVTQQNRIEKNRIEKNRKEILQIWNNVLVKIKTTVNDLNYNAWFKDIVCIEINESFIIVGVEREDQATYLEKSTVALIENIVEKEVGSALKLKVVLIEEK